jgi:hypothetical protein
MTLNGVTQFTSAIQNVLVNTLASSLMVPAAAITITSPVTGRRLLQATTVSFTVATANTNSAALLAQQITSFSGSSSPFLTNLNLALINAQISGVQVSQITVSQPVTGGAAAPTKVQPWNAHKKISIGLGVGLGLGIGLPLVIITAYCCRKPAESNTQQSASV